MPRSIIGSFHIFLLLFEGQFIPIFLCVHLIHIRHRIRLDLHFPSDKPLHVKGVFRVCVGQIFVMRMLCDDHTCSTETGARREAARCTCRHPARQAHPRSTGSLPELLIVQRLCDASRPRALAGVVAVDGFACPSASDSAFSVRRVPLPPKKMARSHMLPMIGFRAVFVQGLELALRLQNQDMQEISLAANRRHQLFKFRNLPDIGGTRRSGNAHARAIARRTHRPPYRTGG